VRRTRRSGSVFVLSLAVLAGLVSVIAIAASSQRMASKAQLHRMEQRRAHVAAEAGIQRALAELVTQPNSPTLQTDNWYLLGTNADESFTVGTVSFRVQVIDASSLVNINTATQDQLELLPLTAEQVDCLLDWREAGTSPRSDGAKDEYYNNLTNPYNTKLGAFSSIDELMLVKGITAETLYTIQTNVVNTTQPTRTTPTGQTIDVPLEQMITVDSTSQAVNANSQTKLNVNTAQAAQIVQRAGVSIAVAQAIVGGRPGGGYTSIGSVLAVPGVTVTNARDILNNLTTGGQNQTGKINLNTVTQTVLDTIPNLPPDAASAIISRQSTGFTQLGDLLDVPGMNNLATLQQTAGYFEVNSQTFLVRVLGKAGASTVALQATVALNNGQPKIIRIEQPPYADPVTEWGWNTDVTTTTVLKDVNQ